MAGASESSSGVASTNSHLSSLVPTFDPAKDDMIIYSQKVEIVLAAWPKEKLTELVTRLMLNAQGSAFQKLQLHQAELLADNDPKHVRRLVELLGGQWGRIALEKQYHDAEQALYHSVQQADESNDSFIARCDILWNRLLARKLTLEDLQSYIVLRGSLLSAEEKKKVILDSDQSLEGRLTIKRVTEAIRVLGASFFGEMTGSKKQIRSKVYDQSTLVAEAVEQAESMENALMAHSMAEPEDEDQILAEMMREGDVDAALIADFEGAASELLQEDEELASAYTAYEDARRRLAEKYRNRGFWPVNRGPKGKGKGKKRWDGDPAFTPSSKGDSWYDKNSNQRRKTLQDRILQSNCRLCGRRGHWKAECPEKHKAPTSSSGTASTMAPTSLAMIDPTPQTSTDQCLPLEFLQLPEMQTLDEARAYFGESFVFWCSGDNVNSLSVLKHRLREHRERLFLGKTSEEKSRSESIRARLASRSRVNFEPSRSRHPPSHDTGVQSSPNALQTGEVVCFATHSSLGILDLGASKTVIGSQHVSEFLQHLKPTIREKIRRCPCAITFRFGNQGTLMSKHALVVPIGQMLLKVAVVPGATPFLLSNTLMRALQAQIDCSKHVLRSPWLKHAVKLTLTNRGLFLLDVNELIDATHVCPSNLKKTGKPTETFVADGKESSQMSPKCTIKHGAQNKRSLNDQSTCQLPKDVTTSTMQHKEQTVGSSVSVRSLIDQFEGKSNQRHVVVPASAPFAADRAIGSGGHLSLDAARTANGSDQFRPSPCRSDVSAGLGTGSGMGEFHHQSLSDQQQDGTSQVPSLCGAEDSTPREASRTGASGSPRCSANESTGDPDAQWKVKEHGAKGKRLAASKQGQGIFSGWHIQSGRAQRRERDCPGAVLQRLRRRGSGFQSLLIGRDDVHESSGQSRGEPFLACDASGDGQHGAPTAQPRERTEPSDSAPGKAGRSTSRELSSEDDLLNQVAEDPCLADVEVTCEMPTHCSPDQKKLNSLIHQMTAELERAQNECSPQGGRATLFEVFCNENSKLTEQVKRSGKTARRFGIQQGDLSTVEGRSLLFQQLVCERPRHVWVSPDCGPWSSWTRLNESQSCERLQHYQAEREQKLFQIALGIVLYRFQRTSRGHFHWEQPVGSSMLRSPLVSEVHEQTRVSQFDMCNIGQLVDPQTKVPMKKGMNVLTSSNQMFETLHGRTCRHNHVHQAIEGTTVTKEGPMLRTKFTENYPRTFARIVAQSMCRPSPRDPALSEPGMAEVFVVRNATLPRANPPRQTIRSELMPIEELKTETHPTKRRRLAMKQTIENNDDSERTGKGLVQKIHQMLPRVGKRSITELEVLQEIQCLFPEKHVIEAIACRGTDRTLGPPKNVTRETAPFRRSIILHREDGKIYVERNWENWKNLSQRQIVRPAHPCRINITVFGANPTSNAGEQNSKESPAEAADQEIDQEMPAVSSPQQEACQKSPLSAPSQSTEHQSPEAQREEKDLTLEKTCDRMSFLSQTERNMIMKVHSNLGHPSNERLSKALREARYRAAISQAALELKCPSCSACSHPKQQRPANLRPYLDFNHRIMLDGIKWTNSVGESFHFYHILDAGSNYHVATCAPSRTSESLLEILGRSWISWAGPPAEMLVDSATEMNSTEFQNAMHRLNVKCTTICPEAHWQNGKIERHGGFLQEMLQKVDLEMPIKTYEDLQMALNQCTQAKNMISLRHGYTPQMIVFGKQMRLPGSILGDEALPAHEEACNEHAVDQKFRKQLALREIAGRAFHMADNSSALRKAILRRSHPHRGKYTPGSWIMIWKSVGIGKHAWIGPLKVIVQEGDHTIWSTGGGKIFRSPPEHVKPADAPSHEEPNPKELDETEISLQHQRMTTNASPQNETNYDPPETVPQETSNENTTESEPNRQESQQSHDLESIPQPDHEPESIETPPPASADEEEIHYLLSEEPANVLLAAETDKLAWRFEATCRVDKPIQEYQPNEQETLVLLASTSKKQRSEVKLSTLNPEEQEQFRKAKDKEIANWMSTDAVAKIMRDKLPAENILRCRWICTWKPIDDPRAEITGEKREQQYKAKARLVVLGFMDPALEDIPRDSPTMNKTSRMIILQTLATKSWDLMSFDIRTAFLQGKPQTGRTLAIEPVEELRSAMGLKSQEVCQLKKSAYGLVDAPFQWFAALREQLISLQFSPSPFDPCVFTLMQPDSQGKPQLAGILGIHVDDGLGGGNEFYHQQIQKLEAKFPFGEKKHGQFTFTGIEMSQLPDKSITLSQSQYVRKINPIQIDINRKTHLDEPVTDQERLDLRAIIGSLQYAAVNTRPDIASKLSFLQSAINSAKVSTLTEANKLLHEAKKHHDVSITIKAIPKDVFRFMAFSDASFSSNNKPDSHAGSLIVGTYAQIQDNKQCPISPISWGCRKIQKVVTSTLAAETMSLAASLDQLSWLRLFWDWIHHQGTAWKRPGEVLPKLAPAITVPTIKEEVDIAVTDCRSLFDLINRTATPACAEFRIQLMTKAIKEAIQEGTRLRWVHSGAQLADCLTKAMEASFLRETLKQGTYKLCDEETILKARSKARDRIRWLKENNEKTI